MVVERGLRYNTGFMEGDGGGARMDVPPLGFEGILSIRRNRRS